MSIVLWQAVTPQVSWPLIQGVCIIIGAGSEGAEEVCSALHGHFLSQPILLLQNLYNLDNLNEELEHRIQKINA